jgi:hypothetical protein
MYLLFAAYADGPMFSWTFLCRRRSGRLLSSTPRLVMLTVGKVRTTMFALGPIALVLQTPLSYQ